jgi:NADPH2:quinone reductase
VSETIPAAVVREYGKPPEFGPFDAPPAPADGQVLVEVEAAGLNPVDIAFGEQNYTIPSPPVLYVAGIEAVGRVLESATPHIEAGARVYVDLPVIPHGTFAARALSYAASTVAIPEDADPGIACALGIAGIAALASLHYRAKLEPGEHVVVLGATGVVGTIAVQIARMMGAGSIVAVGRNRERLDALRGLGATATVQLGSGSGSGSASGSGEDLTEAIREATGGGANVVLDMLCGEPAAATLEATAIGGRLVQLGRSAGETMLMRSATIRGKTISIIGHTNVWTPLDVRRAGYEWMLERAADGELHVEVETLPLADVADAWTRQKSSPGHKLVLAP